MTIITYVQMLGAMSAWLDKAAIEAAGKGGDAILEAGLIDDMFPLSAQVRIACDEATAKVKRLTTKSLVPSHDNETMIAFLIEQIVTDAGYEVVGPVSRLARALEVAASKPLSGALLDVNLTGDLTWPLAHALQDRGIPFVFMTGYAQRGFVPAEFDDVPVIGKPFHAEQVLAAIAEMVGETVIS